MLGPVEAFIVQAFTSKHGGPIHNELPGQYNADAVQESVFTAPTLLIIYGGRVREMV